VTIPHDLLEKLAPHQSGLSQAWATIIAAVIALVAAGLAVFGVWLRMNADVKDAQRTRRADAARARHDRRAQADVARQNRFAEAEKARHADRIRLLAEAAELSQSMWDVAYELTGRRSRCEDTGDRDLQFHEQFMKATLTIAMLHIHGLPKSATSLTRFIQAASVLAYSAEKDPADAADAATRARADMLREFIGEVALNPPEPQASSANAVGPATSPG
jgi:hypothetical protein